MPKPCEIDTWVEAGWRDPAYFDPMIAKIIPCWEPTREAASAAIAPPWVATAVVTVIETNIDYIRQILLDNSFCQRRNPGRAAWKPDLYINVIVAHGGPLNS